jgi:hypothetical protein
MSTGRTSFKGFKECIKKILSDTKNDKNELLDRIRILLSENPWKRYFGYGSLVKGMALGMLFRYSDRMVVLFDVRNVLNETNEF